ncbi:MAG TPA: AMP-binding protein [Acidimicrobiales bacterium]|jgi:long-chain acyl-CoA synthetase
MSSTPATVEVEVLRAAEAEAGQRRAAGSLLAQGCRVGDRVAFSLGSSADLICAVLGAARIGVIPVLLNATLTERERDALVADSQPTLRVFTPAALAALLDGPSAELAPYPLTRPMHYTSGTTGTPKGVTTGIWDEATARTVFEDEASVWQFDPDDLHMVCSPMYHTVSIRFSTGTLLSGGSLAILSRFDASTALDVLRRLRPSTAFLVPTHLQRILGSGELGADETFDSLRFLAHAGAPCPPVVKRATMERVRPGAVWEFYGSTEGQFTVCRPDEWLAHPGTVGRARPGRTLSIVPLDPAPGDPTPNGAPEAGAGADRTPSGTIWCAMPPFARFSYWGDEAATAAAWRGDACTVGDLGTLDTDGYLYLTGRRHDLIISGGVNVYPAEVEAVLAAVPGLGQLAVFGLPDERWGQKVCVAYVATKAGVEDALRAAAASHLAPYKRPKSYFAAQDLPHTATGKLLRRDLPAHLGLAPNEAPGPG